MERCFCPVIFDLRQQEAQQKMMMMNEEKYRNMRPQLLPAYDHYFPPMMEQYQLQQERGATHPPQHYHPAFCGKVSSTIGSSGEHGRGGDKIRQLPCKTFLSVGCCPYRDRCVYIHDPRLASVTSKSKSRKKNKEDPENVVDSFYWPALPRSELTYSFPSGKCKSEFGPTPKASVFQMYLVPSSFAGYSAAHTPCTGAAVSAYFPPPLPPLPIYRHCQQPPRRYNDSDAMFSMSVSSLPTPPHSPSLPDLRWSYFVEICQKNSQLVVLSHQDPSRKTWSDEDQDDQNDPPEALLNRLTQTKRLLTFVSLASTGCTKGSFTSDITTDDFSIEEEDIQYDDPAATSLSCDDEEFLEEWNPSHSRSPCDSAYLKTISSAPQAYPSAESSSHHQRTVSTPSPHSWIPSPIYSHYYGDPHPHDPYRVSPISVVHPLSCSPMRPFYTPKHRFYS